MSEVVSVARRILPRLGRVDRNPFAAGIELRPTMVAGNLAGAIGFGGANRKSDREARRISARARQRDE